MRFRVFLLRCLVLGVVTQQALVPPACLAVEPLGRLKRLFLEATYHGTQPETGQDGAMECLAENIDWLEHHVDTYGSVVAKQPDIWGEARLTKHRDEYERMMFTRLGEFGPTINASFSQSDSSFLAQAIALSAAATGGAAPTTSAAANASPEIKVGSVVAQTREADNVTDQTTTTFNNVGFTSANEIQKINLEPATYLDQMSRYLKHLHELRRINEGDDTSDSPGYSLNLVRIPVSILPGKLTRQGFGAEITVTAQPVISDDLMPTTFQNLVVNDIVDFLGLPLVRVTERLELYQAPITRQIFAETRARIDTIYHEDKLSQMPNSELRQRLLAPVSEFLSDPLGASLLAEVYRQHIDELADGESLTTYPAGLSSNLPATVLDAARSAYNASRFTDTLSAETLPDDTIPCNEIPHEATQAEIDMLVRLQQAILSRNADRTVDELVRFYRCANQQTLTVLQDTTEAALENLQELSDQAPAAAPRWSSSTSVEPDQSDIVGADDRK